MTSPGGAPAARTGTTVGDATRSRFRPELQGLRALAVLLVVVYHVWVGRVSGGVDVFFLITGFLITGGLYRSRGAWAGSTCSPPGDGSSPGSCRR